MIGIGTRMAEGNILAFYGVDVGIKIVAPVQLLIVRLLE